MSKQRSNSSEAMVKFLRERVESNQGISLQKLTGHLSQLPSDLRTKYGCSVKSLKIFLQQFPKVFVIRNQSNVYVRTKSRRTTSSLNGSMESFMTSTSDRGTDDDEVTCLTNVKGTVYRIFNVYGFIAVKYPIKTSVYFDVQAFENAEHSNLPSSGLQVNDVVILDAKVGPKDCEAKFRASRVMRAKNGLLSSTCSSPASLSVSGSGGGSGTSMTSPLVDQDGVIETVKANYGFIKFGRNQRERAFFHANNVDKSVGRSIKNLPDVFTVEDKVRFNAKPSKKPSDKVKWEATTVYLSHRSVGQRGTFDSDDESGNEVFMSDDESDIQDLLQGKLNDGDSCDADIDESPVGYADWDMTSVKGASSDISVQGKLDLLCASNEWEAKRKVSGERGFFYPDSETDGSVRFGPSQASVASAKADVTYQDGEQVGNLLWEVCDGQEVCFDAVEAEHDVWVATLVWTGKRPEGLPHVSDSEAIFNKLTNKAVNTEEPVANSEQEPGWDFGEADTVRNMSPPPSQLSVSIFTNAKATIVKSMKCIGICVVQERKASRKIEFTSDCFYKNGSIFLGDLNELLQEGDTVNLDYMVGVSATRKEIVHCDLVWQGKKPIGVPQLSPEKFDQRLRMEVHAASTSTPFEELETEVERADEASRTPSQAASDLALSEDVLPSRQSSSVSVTSIPVDGLPSTLSSPARSLRGPRPPKEACGSMTTASILTAEASDDVLLRLAKMVAAEITAERERTRIVLHDIGVQTTEDPWTSSLTSLDGMTPPTLVSSSTQTLSTGGIKSEELFIN